MFGEGFAAWWAVWHGCWWPEACGVLDNPPQGTAQSAGPATGRP
jgi:hypothetical protein